MQPKKELKLFIEKYRNDPGYILEGVLIDITEQIARLMVEYKMNRVQLANKLKCSPAYITKLMNGDENLTVKKLVQIAMALGADISISLDGRKRHKTYREYPMVANRKGKKGGYAFYG